MFIKNKTDWNLLAKHMAGETNEKESVRIKAWAESSAGNKALLHDIKTDWKKMDTMKAGFDVDKAWSKLHTRILSVDNPVEEKSVKQQKHSYISVTLRIAASLLLLTILGISVAKITSRLQTLTVTAAMDEKGKLVKLPDGSSVYLNANASLNYSRKFSGKNREVRMEGEAFFDIAHDKNRPFSIYAGNACVKVLGTSFNVNSRKSEDHVEVYVSTGIVELSQASNQKNSVLLLPGNIGFIDHNAIRTTTADNENCIAWKTNSLTFHDTRLTEVIPVLNAIYHVNIIINEPGVIGQQITGSYQGDPLHDILAVICQQNNLKIVKSSDTIYLSH